MKKIKELGLDFFTEDFEGMTVSTTKCLSCETVTEQKETMIDIALPVPISDYTGTSNSFIQVDYPDLVALLRCETFLSLFSELLHHA